MPASETSATVSPACIRSTSSGGPLLLVVLVVADELSRSRRSGRAASRVRRVSSQATTSASRSAESTRSVTSSRLPIGVGQTTSRPLTPLRPRARAGRRRACPASSPKWAADPHRRRGPAAARAARTTSRAGPSSRSPAATAPPPITITSGLNTLTSPTSPAPSLRPIARQHRPRRRIAVVGQLGDERAGDLAARSASAPSAEPGSAPAADRPSSPIASPEASTSRQPRPGQSPGQSLAVDVDHHVAELGADAAARRGRCARRSGCRRRSRCRARPSPRGRRPARRRAGASASIARLASLSTYDRQAEPLAHQVAERHVVERQVIRPQRHARAASTRAGMPKPTALTSGDAARTSSTASTKISSVSWRSAPRQVRCTRWWTTRSSSTTPPSSFVPPASIPMTRLGGMAGRYTEPSERFRSETAPA